MRRSTKNKHLPARMNLVKEAMDELHLLVEHMSAEEMIVDDFSKPYDPSENEPFTVKEQKGY